MTCINKPNLTRQQNVFIIVLVLIFNFLSLIPMNSRGQNQCNIGALPSVRFKSGSPALSVNAKTLLATAATKLKENPFCQIVAIAYPPPSKSGQALCEKRLDAIMRFLIEGRGISADRITINCEVGEGDPNTVDLKENM